MLINKDMDEKSMMEELIVEDIDIFYCLTKWITVAYSSIMSSQKIQVLEGMTFPCEKITAAITNYSVKELILPC